jgi:hypothetical protein
MLIGVALQELREEIDMILNPMWNVAFADQFERSGRSATWSRIRENWLLVKKGFALRSHQRKTRRPMAAPMTAMMAHATAYQIATKAVPSFLQASV